MIHSIGMWILESVESSLLKRRRSGQRKRELGQKSEMRQVEEVEVMVAGLRSGY